MSKQYLGDAVYAEDDGYSLILTTSNGRNDTNTILLDPEVWRALCLYVRTLHPEQQPCRQCDGTGFE